ncbi:PLATZ transcription factor family protein [Salvia divinorum]|uniref:PLATZ transcription factor family protein n=1 Tax=Salvia divinorum TaxID=28513 RepID=A0ABD1G0F0_SALDI
MIRDITALQPYTINSAKVILLNQREQSRSCKGSSANSCFTCHRILQDPFHFCSLSGKVDYMVYQGGDVSEILYKIDFAISRSGDLRVDVADGGAATPPQVHFTKVLITERVIPDRRREDFSCNLSAAEEKGRPKGLHFLDKNEIMIKENVV